MAYNPYKDVNEIYKAGINWQNEQDSEKRKTIQQNAQQYYNNLRNSGYSDLADKLQNSDSTVRKQLADYYKKFGMSNTRDYLYSKGKSYGMSSGDIDNLIEWDNQTGEVSFGGKKIGTPDSVVDGVSYWSDTSVLDNAFNDYISRSGTVRSKSTAVNQENEKLFAKYNQEYEDLKKTNPFETETGKAILAKYDLAGLQGRDNAVADNAGSNGGNIDSFAAANALRQQSSLINQGQMVALEAHQQKLDHARNLLSDMGINIDRVFNQDETAKNNDVARKAEMSAVTGEAPIEWTLQNDPFYREYVDENGNLKEQYKNKDFQVEINAALDRGDTETAKKYAVLRGMKISKYFDEFRQYADKGNVAYLSPKPTEEARQFNDTMQYNYDILETENQTKTLGSVSPVSSRSSTSAKGSASKSSSNSNASKPTLTAAQAKDAVKNGLLSQTVLDAFNYWYGTDYTMDSPPTAESADGAKENKAPLTEKEVEEWVEYLNEHMSNVYGFTHKVLKQTGKNQYAPSGADYGFIINQVFSSDDLTTEQKKYLLLDKFGITEEQIDETSLDPHYN